MKAKVLVYSALSGAVLLAAAIYAHVSGKGQLSILGIIVICGGAPLMGLAMWFRHDWYPKKIAEMSDSERRDQEKP